MSFFKSPTDPKLGKFNIEPLLFIFLSIWMASIKSLTTGFLFIWRLRFKTSKQILGRDICKSYCLTNQTTKQDFFLIDSIMFLGLSLLCLWNKRKTINKTLLWDFNGITLMINFYSNMGKWIGFPILFVFYWYYDWNLYSVVLSRISVSVWIKSSSYVTYRSIINISMLQESCTHFFQVSHLVSL